MYCEGVAREAEKEESAAGRAEAQEAQEEGGKAKSAKRKNAWPVVDMTTLQTMEKDEVRKQRTFLRGLFERDFEGTRVKRVKWLPPGYASYALPATTFVASAPMYKAFHVVGMDAASMAAVSLLNIESGSNVLDMCCAPGAKLSLMAELVGDKGSVTGVDISENRLRVAQHMARNTRMGSRVRLFCCDGQSFSYGPPLPFDHFAGASTGDSKVDNSSGEKKGKKKGQDAPPVGWSVLYPKVANDRLRTPQLVRALRKHYGILYAPHLMRIRGMDMDLSVTGGYDCAFVDAECTHDASVRHVAKVEAQQKVRSAWLRFVVTAWGILGVFFMCCLDLVLVCCMCRRRSTVRGLMVRNLLPCKISSGAS